MKLDASTSPAVRRFEDYVRGELDGTNLTCSACGATVPRSEIHDNSHTIWIEAALDATPRVCGPVVK